MKNISILFFFIVNLHYVGAQSTSSVNWNAGGTYYENNTTQIADLDQLKDGYTVNLPHTWNQWDALDITPGYRRDASWYIKTLDQKISKNQRYFLYFEAANKEAEIYVNGQLAGRHVGGYVGFEIELTKYLRKKNNQIAVRVDNGFNPDIIPSEKADFFIYGGLIRDVYLESRPLSFVKNIQISTPEVNQTQAQTRVALRIEQHKQEALKYYAELVDPSGKIIHKTTPVDVNSSQLTFDFDLVNSPELWSTTNPNLYQVKVSLTKNNNQLIHQKQVSFGYRWYRFDDHGAFYLNGARLKIRGTHRH
ncbi:MAG: sugar-binding domain-containing protein, partial [Bacteroidota bacterium]